jgi:hypothetical protein
LLKSPDESLKIKTKPPKTAVGIFPKDNKDMEDTIMTIKTETSLEYFDAWSGAIYTLNRLKELDKCDEAEALIEELYPDGLTDTELNDILWFEDEWLFEALGIVEDEEEEEEEEDEDEEE